MTHHAKNIITCLAKENDRPCENNMVKKVEKGEKKHMWKCYRVFMKKRDRLQFYHNGQSSQGKVSKVK